MEKLYTVSKAKTRPGVDCGSDHELLIAKFRLKWKKVGKTTRPFRCDLNKIPCNYTVEVTNRLKGLDLIEYLKNYEWSRPSPKKRNAKRQNGCLRRPYKTEKRREGKGKEKERYTHLNVEFQRIARRDKKAFFCEQWICFLSNKRVIFSTVKFLLIHAIWINISRSD